MSSEKLAPSQRLAQFTDEADRIFNHLLGYIIAFTSLVAFADVLGNGEITQYIPWLFWIWVMAQGLCVEFQVFVLIRRLPGYWTTNRKLFWAYIVFIGLLCSMSVLIGSIFVEHDNAHGTIEQAMTALGINHTGFIYARSSLAILLVALIAIDRAITHHEQQKIVPAIQVQTPDIEPLIEQAVNQRLMPFLEQLEAAQNTRFEATVQRVIEEVHVTIEQVTAPRLQAINQGTIDPPPGTKTPRQIVPPKAVNRVQIVPSDDGSIGEKVQRYLEQQMHQGKKPTLQEIMNQTGCSKGTAISYRKRYSEPVKSA